jgi:hypothetical protein
LGALLTIVVLVVAAMQIPKFRRTSAESPAAQTPAAVATPEQAPAAPVDAPMPATTETAEQPAVQRPQERKRLLPEPVVRRGSPRRETSPPAEEPAAPATTQDAPAQPSEPASADAAELRDIREQLMLLGIRAGAAKKSLSNLERQQAQQGLGLRSDIAGAAQRMEYYLDETEAALKRGDAVGAKKNLESAERIVSKIESFLGH